MIEANIILNQYIMKPSIKLLFNYNLLI